jgi:hypothetical protein
MKIISSASSLSLFSVEGEIGIEGEALSVPKKKSTKCRFIYSAKVRLRLFGFPNDFELRKNFWQLIVRLLALLWLCLNVSINR